MIPSVAFNGFEAGDLPYLKARAERAGLQIASDSRSADLLVVGGHKKPECREGQKVMDRDHFFKMLDTLEI